MASTIGPPISWEPLLAIADLAGGMWPDRARKAALALSGDDADEQSIGALLLGDIAAIFREKAFAPDGQWNGRVSSRVLADALVVMDGRPWAEWKGKPITPHAIARLLRPFGIKPQDQLRIGQRNSSGYEAAAFEDAFNRYFRSNPPPATPTTPTALKPNGNSENQTPTADSRVGVRNGENNNGINGVGVVGVENPPPRRENETERPPDDLPPWEIIL